MAKSINEMYAERGIGENKLFSNYNQYSSYGFVDQTRPTERQTRQDFRGIFFRCLEMRSDAIANALCNSYVEREIGQNEYEEVEVAHPWFQLLKNPSKIWSARDVYRWAMNEYDLTGAADFIIERGPGNMPLQLLPLYREFGHIEIAPSSEGGINNWILYRSDGKIIPIERENVLRLDRKSPWSPFESVSLVEAARFELDTSHNMKDYRKNSVENGGFSSPIVTTEQDLTPDQHKQLASDYKQFIGNRGLRRGKVLTLANGAKPHQAMSARDLEYIQGEVQTDKTIMIIAGVPPGLFETVTTRATADAAQVVFSQLTITPLLSLFSEQLTHQFEIIFGADPGMLYIQPPEVVPLDKEFELKQRQAYLSTGLRTHNDFQRVDGEEEFPEGDKRYIPFGWRELDESEPERPEPERSVRTTDQRAELWRSIDKKKRRQAELLKPVLNEWFEGIQRDVIKEIEKEYEPRSFTQDVFDRTQEEWRLMNLLSSEVLRVLQAGFANGMSLAKITGLEFPLNSPFVENTLKTILEKQSTIPETLFTNLSDKIKKGIEEGLSKKDMADSVSDFFGDMVPGKVENISNGLSTSAWEAGQDVAYNEAGIKEREWLSSRDGRVRDSHIAIDGERVGISERFQVGTSELRFPGDPNGEPEEVIGCRCVTLPVTFR